MMRVGWDRFGVIVGIGKFGFLLNLIRRLAAHNPPPGNDWIFSSLAYGYLGCKRGVLRS